jgi:hypothetical protein
MNLDSKLTFKGHATPPRDRSAAFEILEPV